MAQVEHNYTDATESKDFSTVRIADDVVAMIASYAAREVDGVAGMVGTGSNWLTKNVATKTKGVRVEVENGSVRADLSINMDYGFNIPATCSKIQARVQQAIESMTGLTVADINIRIAGITMPKEETPAPAPKADAQA